MEGKVDEYFPEMLARDLEISSAVFAAKNMTAGTPSLSLWVEEKTKPRSMSCPSRLHPLVSERPYHTGSSRVQTLGAIEERDSMVSFIEHQQYATDDTTSDAESLTGTESSMGIEPPSIRLREQSIITTATSLTSTSGHPPSPKDLMAHDRAQEYSWIDVDSDDDADLGEDEEGLTEEQPVALSPRPPTPPSLDSHLTTRPSRELSRPSRIPHPSTHTKNRSLSSGSSTLPRRKHSVNSIDVPLRGDSSKRTSRLSESHCDLRLAARKPRTNALTQRRSLQLCRNTQIYEEAEVETSDSFDGKSFRVDGDSIDLDNDSMMDIDVPSWPRPNTVYMKRSPLPSPLPSVETWLDQSNPTYPSQLLGEDLAKTVPLPPDIIETLRVSIACFPETMLLSSSLTVETIRAYSRKVRQPSTDVWKDFTLLDTTPHNNRRSIWKKVVSHGRESLSSRRHRTQPQHESDDLESSNPGTSMPPTPWAPLRHVFSNCSDYICDALYAHIVAYNYISRVPRSQPPQPPQENRASMATFKQFQNEDIPKKAANLLGISTPHHSAPPAVGRFAKKISSSLRFGKDHMTTTSPSAVQQDNATRNIESGLMRCITRLIATAKLMGQGNTEERMIEQETKEVDMIFVRSLCEIVRIAEEA
ncbi:Fc.00g057260.m01.CDS01 [Cosmosporella sp. VM-42]